MRGNRAVMVAYRKALRKIVDEEFGGSRRLLDEARRRDDPFLRVLAIDTWGDDE